jgi:primosomal protein N' (replication factor Y)
MKLMFAQVAVNVPSVSGVYSYHIPDALAGSLGPGSLVTVSFGAQTVQGVVLGLAETSPVAETKPILESLDPLPVLTIPQLELARYLAESTSPLASSRSDAPPGLSQQADTLYEVRPTPRPDLLLPRLLSLLAERGALRGRQIDRHFRNVDWRRSMQWLVRRGWVVSRSVLPPPSVRPKFVRTGQLAVPPGQAEAAMPSLGKTEATLERRKAALRFLIREPR